MRGLKQGLWVAAATVAVTACSHLVYKPAQLTDAGRGVVLVMSTKVGAECTWVVDVEARNIHGDAKYMRNKIRNDTAKKGGNVVKVDNWAPRAYASGRGFKCPEETARRLAASEPSMGDDPPAELPPAAGETAAADAGVALADASVVSDAQVVVTAPVVESDAPPLDELPPAPPPPSASPVAQ